MNILIANYELTNFFGGTQTWTITMKKALENWGHRVDITTFIGEFHPMFKSLQKPLLNKYDLLVANGNLTLKKFAPLAEKKIFISHGVLPSLEQPIPGADIYVAVSEEVQRNLRNKGFSCKHILRNPIDVHKFRPNKDLNPTLETIILLDRRRKFPYIEDLKKTYKVIEVGNPPVYDMVTALQPADLVIARGRGIYEAMSMGKNVIVSGNNSGRAGNQEIMDGFVTEDTFYYFRRNNCSGRNQMIKVDSFARMQKELDKYNPEQGEINRRLMTKNNNAMFIAQELLEL